MTELFYLDESTLMVETSAFDKAEIEAFSAVPGPSGRFIALIGLHRNDIALYVLDTEKDTIPYANSERHPCRRLLTETSVMSSGNTLSFW